MVVTALPVGQGDSSSSGRAGRHEATEAEGAPGGVTVLGEAHEEAVIGARAAEAEGDKQLPSAPATRAPVAPSASLGEAIGSAHQTGAPAADHLDAPSSSQVDPCAQLLGRFRVNFDALRKRREALGDNYPCRLLKRTKYFATDE